MSARVGDESGFVDTQGIQIENITDALIYEQVLSVSPANIDHTMSFHQLTNDTVEKLFGLTDAAFEVIMMVTQPELNVLLTLSLPTTAQLTEKEWAVHLTDQSNRTTLVSGDAVIRNLRILDTGLGSVQLSLSLEFSRKDQVRVLDI